MTVTTMRRQALAFMAERQRDDGSFAAWSSTSIAPFKPVREQPTIFSTAMILNCLRQVAGAEAIVAKAEAYVASQMQSQGSWNYWQKGSEAISAEPYPDDLDDTACALAALGATDPQRIGAFARLLVASESKTGGPYNTWLVDYHSFPQWKDVDIAVNANVGYALSMQGVCPSGLRRYIEESIANNKLRSSYYVGTVPVLYFLARWYKGDVEHELQSLVLNAISNDNLTVLEAALLCSAASPLGVDILGLQKAFADSFKDGHWPAEALYVDPQYDGHQHYGGSAELTTAFVLEALGIKARNPKVKQEVPRKKLVNALATSASFEVQNIANKYIRDQYAIIAKRVAVGEGSRQITMPATLIAQAGSWELQHDQLQHLNSGSLNGWIAYTVYDDFLDGGAEPEMLNVANVAHRRSYQQYLQALPHNSDFSTLVDQAFDTMDAANAWELQHARLAKLDHGRLPNYGDYQQLADRSWGHSLAGSGVILQVFGHTTHKCFVSFKQFFTHFLIARQLNDDAHDWEDDLRQGQLSAVVVMLLMQRPLLHDVAVANQLPELREVFWQQTINQAAQTINHHLELAKRALKSCAAYMDIEELEHWLKSLEQSTALAIKRRDETLNFIESFGGYRGK